MLTSVLSKKVSLAFVFFGIISSVSSASDNFFHVGRRHLQRRQSIPTTLPGTWASLGCLTDGPGFRALSGAVQASATNTIESCIAFCESKNFVYAGTEYGAECYCGNSVASMATDAAATDCNMPCSGNPEELCGAGWRLNLFWNGQPPPPSATIPATIGNWVSLGCYSDNVDGLRTLPVGTAVSPVTLESCTSACFNAGYRFSGAEYSGECYCGSTIASGAAPAALSDCNMVCSGNSAEYCGGPNLLSLYNYTGTDLPTSGGSGGGGGEPVSISPVTTGLPTGWAYNACWVDNAHGHVLNFGLGGSTTNTIESCVSACAEQGYTLAGTEYAAECYCGNALVNGAATAPEADCNMGCSGQMTEACGGANRLSVYSKGPITALPVPTPLTTGLPGQWQYKGCLREPATTKMFPHEITWPTNNTALACITRCDASGFSASGVEYGEECYCGDVSDVTNNEGVFGDESECNIPCPGDPATICGAGNRLSTYYSTGTAL